MLEKVKNTNKYKDAIPGIIKDIKAEKSKIRTSKIKYKLVDKIYVIYFITVFLSTFYRTIRIEVYLNIKS